MAKKEAAVGFDDVDKRLLEKTIREGRINKKQLTSYLKTLPDLSSEAQEFNAVMEETTQC